MSAGKAGEWFQLKKVTAYQDTRSLDILPAVFYANEKKGVRLGIFRDTEKKNGRAFGSSYRQVNFLH